MKRINISETDLTTNRVEVTLQDRVFIPGFAVNSESEAYIDQAVDCNSLSDFYMYFRGAPASVGTGNYFLPTFNGDQPYPAYVESEVTKNTGFAPNSIPVVTDNSGNEGTIMYKDNTVEPSWTYAVELLEAGIPISYMRLNTKTYTFKTDGTKEYPADYDVTVEKAYEYLNSKAFNPQSTSEVPTYVSPLMSVDDVNVKFITSGGYPTFEYYVSGAPNAISKNMATIAKTRGDCLALIDHTDRIDRDLVGPNSVFQSVNSGSFVDEANASFAALFTPWVSISDEQARPASWAYLRCYIKSIINVKNWLAVAGVNRGNITITGLRTKKPLTNTIAEYYQRESGDSYDISINPITYIKPNGYCIWGNRTLVKATTAATTSGYATSFINLRNLVSDVKKQARYAAKQCLFEPNNDIMWVNFKSYLSPLLDSMVSGNVLKGYKIIKGETSDKQKVVADIRIFPVYAVESFDITITVTDEDVITTTE